MNIYLDIETLPANDSSLVEVYPPKTMSKPETIAKWEAEEMPQAIKDALAKTSFDGLYGSICVICYAVDDEPVQSFSTKVLTEPDMLKEFFASIEEITKIELYERSADRGVTFIGHNVAGFDLQFLKHRSIVHGICPPAPIRRAMNAKPWDSVIGDTMLMWSGSTKVGLDKLCKAMGISGKDGFDGSMVADTWPHNPQKVIDYCKEDVERVRKIYKRLTFDSQ